MVTVGGGGCRRHYTHHVGSAGRARRVLVIVVVVVVVGHVQRAERLLVRGLGVLDEARLRLVRLFLEEAVDFEPVGAASVAGARLRHTHHQTLPQPASLARGAVLLVDHAHAAVLALGDAAEVVVSSPEERLWSRETRSTRARYVKWNLVWNRIEKAIEIWSGCKKRCKCCGVAAHFVVEKFSRPRAARAKEIIARERLAIDRFSLRKREFANFPRET